MPDPVQTSLRTANGLELMLLPLSIEDLEGIALLEASAHTHPWSKTQVLSALQRYHCWGLQMQQQWVGFAALSCVAGEAELLDFVVAPALRGQGAGTSLLDWLQGWAQRELAAQRLYLEVRASNSAALALYCNAGFAEVGLRPGYYPASVGREDAILMAMELMD